MALVLVAVMIYLRFRDQVVLQTPVK